MIDRLAEARDRGRARAAERHEQMVGDEHRQAEDENAQSHVVRAPSDCPNDKRPVEDRSGQCKPRPTLDSEPMAAGGNAAFLAEPARQTPIGGEYEVVVLGGGPAGIAAAAGAARQGRKTLLIERYGFLGGMGTAAGVANFWGLHANVYGDIRQVVHGVADDLLGRIDRLGGLTTPHKIFGKTHALVFV